jgi:hypothetical protein
MNERNPYKSPEELSVQTSSESRLSKAVVSRVVEYAIAIILIIALLWVFMPLVHGNGMAWP